MTAMFEGLFFMGEKRLVAHRNFAVGFSFSREETPSVNGFPRRSQSEASQNLAGSPRKNSQEKGRRIW